MAKKKKQTEAITSSDDLIAHPQMAVAFLIAFAPVLINFSERLVILSEFDLPSAGFDSDVIKPNSTSFLSRV